LIQSLSELNNLKSLDLEAVIIPEGAMEFMISRMPFPTKLRKEEFKNPRRIHEPPVPASPSDLIWGFGERPPMGYDHATAMEFCTSFSSSSSSTSAISTTAAVSYYGLTEPKAAHFILFWRSPGSAQFPSKTQGSAPQHYLDRTLDPVCQWRDDLFDGPNRGGVNPCEGLSDEEYWVDYDGPRKKKKNKATWMRKPWACKDVQKLGVGLTFRHPRKGQIKNNNKKKRRYGPPVMYSDEKEEYSENEKRQYPVYDRILSILRQYRKLNLRISAFDQIA
ncbi:hypothetical protein BGZ83_000731, partial [Gryganskiella cystojenkinii]